MTAIAPDRLLALNWPGRDLYIGGIIIGRHLMAWRNLKGLTISFGGDAILSLDRDNEILTLTCAKTMPKARFCKCVQEAVEILGLGRIELNAKRDRLVAVYNGRTVIADSAGKFVIEI